MFGSLAVSVVLSRKSVNFVSTRGTVVSVIFPRLVKVAAVSSMATTGASVAFGKSKWEELAIKVPGDSEA